MGKINILDSAVFNQIAAGEVVENPASIVKELVENSIDAGAINITVTIEEGGIKSVNIIDDGEGMDEQDLMKCVLPHTTSKIRNAADLQTIATLGFRGEALASIASVSFTEIKSKYYQSDVAYSLQVKGGEISDIAIAPLNKGTSITITRLFYNTPARFKFLKSKKSEENNVTSTMQDIILANPTIAFRYYIDKKLMYSSSGEGLKSSIESIYDKDITDNFIEVDFQENPYKVYGFIAKPDSPAIKFNRNYQTIIINGRSIKDFTLSAVVQNAYGEKLMRRTFPAFVLDILMPFDLVDVNVHPNKKEVRFASKSKINSIIYNSIKQALQILTKQDEEDIAFLNTNRNESSSSYQTNHIKNDNVLLKKLIPNNHIENIQSNVFEQEKVDEINKKLDYLSKTSPKLSEHITRLKEENAIPDEQKPDYKVVGQAFNTYILIEHEQNLFLIDQHAAHERILYDSYLTKLNKKPLDVQDLMIPFLYDASNNYDIIMKNSSILSDMGFELEEFGNNLIKVLSVPLQFTDINIDMFLNEVCESLVDIKNFDDIETLKNKIATKACKSAIKGGAPLNNEDIIVVMDKFTQSGIPLQCPHGRPVIIKLTKTQIEKMFRRII